MNYFNGAGGNGFVGGVGPSSGILSSEMYNELQSPGVDKAIGDFMSAMNRKSSFYELTPIVVNLMKSKILRVLLARRGDSAQMNGLLKNYLLRSNHIPHSFYDIFTNFCRLNFSLDDLNNGERYSASNGGSETTIYVKIKRNHAVPVNRMTFATAQVLTRQLAAQLQSNASTFVMRETRLSDAITTKFTINDELRDSLPNCMVQYYDALNEAARRNDKSVAPYLKRKRLCRKG